MAHLALDQTKLSELSIQQDRWFGKLHMHYHWTHLIAG